MLRSLRAVRSKSFHNGPARSLSSRPGQNEPSGGISFGTFLIVNSILVPGSLIAAAYASSKDAAAAARVKEIPGLGPAVEWTGEKMGFENVAPEAKSFVVKEEPPKAKKIDMSNNSTEKPKKAKKVEKVAATKVEEKQVAAPVVAAAEAPKVIEAVPAAPTKATATANTENTENFPPSREAYSKQQQEKTQTEQATSTDPTAPPVVIIDYSHLPLVQAESTSHRISDVEIVSNVADELQKQTVALRKELEATILSDLHKLDEHALRTRVTQLAAEFFERTKWEGVRLHQSLRKVEEEIGRKYKDILVQQRAELELEAHKMLLAREQELMNRSSVRTAEALAQQEEAFSNALRAQAESFKKSIQDELAAQKKDVAAQMQDELNNEVANIRKEAANERMSLQGKINDLSAHVQGFEAASEKIHGLNQDSLNTHKFSAAVLALQSALSSSQALGAETAAVLSSSSNDALVLQVVQGLPETALNTGVPTMEELTLRFAVVREEVRKANLAPEGLPAVVSSAIGAAMAKLYWTPSGPVKGDGAEEILSRAAHRLDNGDLRGSLVELQGLEGDRLSKNLLQDWSNMAKDRLTCEQAAQTLRAQAVIKHAVMANKQ